LLATLYRDEMTDTLVDVRRYHADYRFDGSYHTVSATGQEVIAGVGSAALIASAAKSLANGRPVAAAVTGAVGASIGRNHSRYANRRIRVP
jgi:arsenite methyltransferase